MGKDGANIHVVDGFLTNYNVTILDIAPVRIGEHVMIGPNCSSQLSVTPSAPAVGASGAPSPSS